MLTLILALMAGGSYIAAMATVSKFDHDIQLQVPSTSFRHPQIELVAELLRTGKDWDFDSGRPFYAIHPTGVRIYIGGERADLAYEIRDDAEQYQYGVKLSEIDKNYLWKLFEDIINDRRNKTDRALTVALAKRVLEAERVQGLLGGPGLGFSDPFGPELRGRFDSIKDSVATASITFDKNKYIIADQA